MGFLTRRPPRLSSDARDFIREHPEEARMAVAVVLEAAVAQAAAAAGRPGEEVPEQLRPRHRGGGEAGGLNPSPTWSASGSRFRTSYPILPGAILPSWLQRGGLHVERRRLAACVWRCCRVS